MPPRICGNRRWKAYLTSILSESVKIVSLLSKSFLLILQVAKTLIEIFAEMIFVHGFVHGDPHPGNLLVSPRGHSGFSIGTSVISNIFPVHGQIPSFCCISCTKNAVLLDHGLYKELDEKFRLDYCELWRALILLDSKKIQFLGEKFGVSKYSKYLPVIFTGRPIERWGFILSISIITGSFCHCMASNPKIGASCSDVAFYNIFDS